MRVLTSMYIAIPRPSLRFEGQFGFPTLHPSTYFTHPTWKWKTGAMLVLFENWETEVHVRSDSKQRMFVLSFFLFLSPSPVCAAVSRFQWFCQSRVVLAGSPRWIIHGALQESPSHQRHLIRRGRRGRGPVEVLGVVGVLWVSGSVSFSTTDLMPVLLYSKRTWKGGGQCMTKWSLIGTRDSDKLLLANKRNEKRKKKENRKKK